MSEKDGEIDYLKLSLSELRDIERHIDSRNYPKNYTNLTAAIAAKQGDSQYLSQKDPRAIQREFESTEIKARIITAIFAVMFLPTALNRFVDFEGRFGLDEWGRIWFSLAGLVGYVIYFGFFYTCPNCQSYPGAGWSRDRCKTCGVNLRGSSE